MIDFVAWLVFAATGRVLVYLWMIFPEPPYMKLPWYIEKLHRCDLCSGVWIYAILAIALQIDFFGMNNIVTQATTGAITSFLVHIFVIGWKEKFSPPVVI